MGGEEGNEWNIRHQTQTWSQYTDKGTGGDKSENVHTHTVHVVVHVRNTWLWICTCRAWCYGHAPSYLNAVCARDSVVHLTQTPSLHTHRELTVRLDVWWNRSTMMYNVHVSSLNVHVQYMFVRKWAGCIARPQQAHAHTCTCMYTCAYFAVYL